MSIFRFTEPVDLSEHMLATYQTLRVVLFVIALTFPLVLWIGGAISTHSLPLQGSMSAYYHANKDSAREFALREPGACKPEGPQKCLDSGRGVMRNWFVGVLFIISAMLVVYKGYRPAEDVALNLAGGFAVLVALFPKPWDGPGLPLHGIFAVSFFLCIAYVCIFCASATLPLVKEKGRRTYYGRCYKLLGWAMVASPVLALILTWVLDSRRSYLFFAEAFGVYAFAAYWLVKTLEIRETKADQKAASGKLQSPAGTGPMDVVRQMPVTEIKK
jgi:hypothetical protein